MWQSNSGCLHSEDEIPDKILAKAKGIPVQEVKRRREEGVRKIHILIMLHHYLEYTANRAGPALNPLQESLHIRYPYNLPDIKGKLGYVLPATNKNLFRSFLNDTKARRRFPLKTVLHLSAKELHRLRRHHKENETDG